MYKLNHEELSILSRNSQGSLDGLKKSLHTFFNEHPRNDYFLRFNKLSPKDAYYFMNDSEDDSEDDDELMTLDTIKRDLECLHVRSELSVEDKVNQCIKVITYSDRVHCEAAFLDDADELIFLLLKYRNINHRTETRCFVKDGKLIAISQYYVDLVDVYEETSTVQAKIQDYFRVPRSTLTDYVADVFINAHTHTQSNIELIEFNPFTHGTDPCLFTWDELDKLSPSDLPEFRFVTTVST